MFPSTAFRLSALSASIFALIGVYMPFFPVWLEQRGLDGSTIGIILAVPIVVRIIVTAPLVGLTERGVDARVLLCVSQVVLAAIYLALLGVGGAFAIAVIVACAAVAQAALVPTSDLVTTDAVREDPRLSYGSIRLWGSISFLFFSVAAGYVLTVAPPDAIVVALSVLALLSALVSLGVPNQPSARTAETDKRVTARFPPALIWMIAGAALVQSSHAAIYGFGSIIWRGQGIADSTIGVLWAIGVVAEIILFWLIGRGIGRSLSGVALMLIGAGAAMIRFAALAFEPGLITTFLLQSLHGLSFGAAHLGIMSAMTALAPVGGRGRAQGIFAACMAFAMASSMAASGWLYQLMGSNVFIAMVPVAGLGGLCLFVASRRLKAQPQSSGVGG